MNLMIKNKPVNQITLGAVLSYISIAINILAGLLYTPWMIKQIGQSNYGLYTLANSLIALFLVDFGLSSATARYISKYRAEGDEEKVSNFLGAIYKLYLIIDVVIFATLVVVFFFIENIYKSLTPEELNAFKIIYVIAGGFAVINFPFVTLNGILTAYEKFIQQKLADVLYRILFVGTMIIALLMGYGLYALVSIHAVVGLIIIVYKLAVIKKTTPVRVNFLFKEKSLFKEIFSFSIWVTVSTIAQRLIFNITPSILGIVSNSTAIAVFGVITTIEGYVYTLTTAINGMFMPKISKLCIEKNDTKELSNLFIRVGKYQYFINGLIITGFIVLGSLFINLWVGDSFQDAYYGILLVTVPSLFYNSLQIANTTMIVQNKVKETAFANLATGLINVILSAFLSMIFGVLGACVSICIAYSFRAITLNILYKKLLHLDIKSFVKNCYLKMSIPMIITVPIGYVLLNFLPNNSWMSFIIVGVVLSIIYFISSFILGLNKNERKLILNKIINR